MKDNDIKIRFATIGYLDAGYTGDSILCTKPVNLDNSKNREYITKKLERLNTLKLKEVEVSDPDDINAGHSPLNDYVEAISINEKEGMYDIGNWFLKGCIVMCSHFIDYPSAYILAVRYSSRYSYDNIAILKLNVRNGLGVSKSDYGLEILPDKPVMPAAGSSVEEAIVVQLRAAASRIDRVWIIEKPYKVAESTGKAVYLNAMFIKGIQNLSYNEILNHIFDAIEKVDSEHGYKAQLMSEIYDEIIKSGEALEDPDDSYFDPFDLIHGILQDKELEDEAYKILRKNGIGYDCIEIPSRFIDKDFTRISFRIDSDIKISMPNDMFDRITFDADGVIIKDDGSY